MSQIFMVTAGNKGDAREYNNVSWSNKACHYTKVFVFYLWLQPERKLFMVQTTDYGAPITLGCRQLQIQEEKKKLTNEYNQIIWNSILVCSLMCMSVDSELLTLLPMLISVNIGANGC